MAWVRATESMLDFSVWFIFTLPHCYSSVGSAMRKNRSAELRNECLGFESTHCRSLLCLIARDCPRLPLVLLSSRLSQIKMQSWKVRNMCRKNANLVTRCEITSLCRMQLLFIPFIRLPTTEVFWLSLVDFVPLPIRISRQYVFGCPSSLTERRTSLGHIRLIGLEGDNQQLC